MLHAPYFISMPLIGMLRQVMHLAMQLSQATTAPDDCQFDSKLASRRQPSLPEPNHIFTYQCRHKDA
jgi:hypothetical protein